jgi:hypothetical protein
MQGLGSLVVKGFDQHPVELALFALLDGERHVA